MNTNPEIELAWQCIEKTGSHLFLTGKAGTGKTTFLRKLKELSPKRMIVVAPTGIAAINAGGVTIHSFFQLSFAPYVPETTFKPKQAIYKFGKEKINIIRSMDLLVIDEISMVRSDLLDAVDDVLRRYRDRHKPFGGVQLLMIGDLQQLAPVVKDEEWNLLSQYYETPYFFGSRALKQTEYITIQLEYVYRQNDEKFLGMLNKIRTNNIDDELLNQLNSRYMPDFRPQAGENYIRLTTHNYQASRINEQQLYNLPGKAITYRADIKGNFPESAYPADAELTLKVGAQIMFIKNDSSAWKRFYNGKIGTVTALTETSIRVQGKDDTDDFLLEKEIWNNSKFKLNDLTKEITEQVDGTFTHYPIKLAWAITIHKSQGLTFEHAIIDAGLSFAHGQVYVALSRCKTLEGMVLGSRLTREAVICDETVNTFTNNVENTVPDNTRLNSLMRQYFYDLVCELFGFDSINRSFSQLMRVLDEHFYRLYPKLLERYKSSFELFTREVEKIAERFRMQYSSLIMDTGEYENNSLLQQRIKAGAGYFHGKIAEILLALLDETRIDTDNKENKKKFTESFSSLYELVVVKKKLLEYVATEGFSVTSYLKKKAVILLSVSSENEKTNPKKKAARKENGENAAKVEVPSDILHPILYASLIKWRNREAAKSQLPVYTIIQQKAIMGITNLLPTTASELIRIPYCGKKLVENHGEELIDMVQKYVEENNINKGDLAF